MAKRNLKEATKAATAGMFTVNSGDIEPQPANPKKNDIDTEKKSEGVKIAPAKVEKSVTQKTKKPANDYLYLDLRPAGGADLKTYVMGQAHKTSIEQGRNISATNYIQNLIKKDMESNKPDTTKAKIIEMLDNTTDEKLEAIHTIIKNII